MRNPCERLVPHWVSYVVMFGVLVLPHVLTSGIGTPAPLKLTVAAICIAAVWLFAIRHEAWFQRQDELHQRLVLESLASAFVGTFVLFVTYWLLQLSGLLPPMNGMYFVLVMLTLRHLGADGALQTLLRRKGNE